MQRQVMTSSQALKKEKKQQYKEAFSKRLNTALDYAGYKKWGRSSRLAEQLDLTHQSVRKWVSGETTPSKERRLEIAQLLDININWLENGLGDMLASAKAVKEGIAIIPLSEIETWLTTPSRVEEKVKQLGMPNPRKVLFAYIQEGDAMATLDKTSIPDYSFVIINSEDTKILKEERYLVKFERYENPICRLAKTSDTGEIYFTSTNPTNIQRENFNPETDKVYGRVQNILT